MSLARLSSISPNIPKLIVVLNRGAAQQLKSYISLALFEPGKVFIGKSTSQVGMEINITKTKNILSRITFAT